MKSFKDKMRDYMRLRLKDHTIAFTLIFVALVNIITLGIYYDFFSLDFGRIFISNPTVLKLKELRSSVNTFGLGFTFFMGVSDLHDFLNKRKK